MKLTIAGASKTPVYRQIADQIHFSINTGKLKAGQRLPSLRKLAEENEVALNTVIRAFKHLAERRLIAATSRCSSGRARAGCLDSVMVVSLRFSILEISSASPRPLFPRVLLRAL